jgi:hypothetical protein
VAKVSHIVSGFTKKYRMALPRPHSTAENSSVCVWVSSPFAVGRHAVRAIFASIFSSTRQLKAAAAAATSQMPAVANSTRSRSGQPGSASSMPMTAQKTISCTTRGFVSERYWRSRDGSATAGRVLDRTVMRGADSTKRAPSARRARAAARSRGHARAAR